MEGSDRLASVVWFPTIRRDPGSSPWYQRESAQLRELEHDGVIKRLATQTLPPRVDYMLSDAGSELIPVMEAMCNWGTKHLGVAPNLPRTATKPV